LQKKDSIKDYVSEIPNFLSIFQCSFFTFSLSSILLDVSKFMNVNVGTLNLIFTFNIIGNFIGNLTSPLLNKKIKRINIIIFSYVLLIAVTIGLFLSSSLDLLYIFYFFAGYIVGTIWVQANEYMQESKVENKEKLTTIGYIFFPVGALMGPLVAINIIKNDINWKYLYIVILAFVVLTLFLYIFITKKRDYRSALEKTENTRIKDLFENKSKNTVFILLIILMLFFGATEVSISTWSPTFLRVTRSFLITKAGWAISTYWLAVGVGRIFISTISGKLKTDYLLLVLALISFIGIALFVFVPSSIVIFIAIALTGIGLSGIQPLATAKGSSILNKGIGFAISMLSAAAALGGSAGPYIIKYVSAKSMILSMSVAMIFSLAIIIVLFINIILNKKNNK
jgi:FHS family glucose/mannose:H+ symporter-like MFS transporter